MTSRRTGRRIVAGSSSWAVATSSNAGEPARYDLRAWNTGTRVVAWGAHARSLTSTALRFQLADLNTENVSAKEYATFINRLS
eukprot:802690-Prymnesium_polylepis.2